MLYLLDTNVCIFLMKKKPLAYFQKLDQLEETSRIAISVVTLAELEYGIAKSEYPEKSREALHLLQTRLEVLAYTESCARYYGEIRAELTQKGQLIGPNDLLIASQAVAEKAILVSNNLKEFQRVSVLKVEDWS